MKRLAFLFAAMVVAVAVYAQYNPKDVLPMDTNVRYGKLPNGLTYFVWHNEKPKERCEFHLIQDVGAILEQDDENGLAHFLEHLCFNGTEHYPGKGIINYFESIGVSFGGGINASTSLDVTRYHLSDVPTTREGILDSALLVLYDWSCGVLLQDTEIEAERGVIREEWRTGNDASERIWVRTQQITMPGTPYAKRDVIGDTAVINNFKPQTLRDFYHRWYGPDLQAVIVVGDVDVDKMEQKIIRLFTPVKPREGLTPRPRFSALDNEKPIVGVVLDKEARRQSVEIGFKHPSRPKEGNNTYGARMEDVKRGAIISCLYDRLKEKYGTDQFFGVFPLMSCGYGNMNGETDAFTISVRLENGREKKMYRDLCTELERIRRYGILAEELELYKKDALESLKRYQKTYKDRENSVLRYMCENHFLSNDGITTAEFALDFYNNFTSKLTVEELNEFAKGFFNPEDRNMYIIATGIAAPDENGTGCRECQMPSEEELLAVYLAVKDSAIEAPTFKRIDTRLVDKEPKAGKVVSRNHNELLDVTELVLSNGVKVMVKQTDFDVDNVSLEASSKGGYAAYPVSDLLTANYAGEIVKRNGVGKFRRTDLDKILAGKRAGISGVGLAEHGEWISGYSSTDDFETMLQLVYLQFTEPRADDELFKQYMEKTKSDLASKYNNPKREYYERCSRLMYGNSERLVIPDTNNIKQVTQKRALQIFKERFANPADFIFYIIGDINLEDSSTVASIEKWIGGFHTTKKFEGDISDGVDIIRGTHYDYSKHAMETKTATNRLLITGYGFDYTLTNRIKTELIGNILSTRYLESIREKEGGSYGVSVWCYMDKFNVPHIEMSISFDTDLDKQNRLLNIVYDEIEKIIKEGPLESDLAKEKEILINDYEEGLRDNWSWRSKMEDYYEDGVKDVMDYVNIVRSITGEDIRLMLKDLYEQNNHLEMVLMPTR